MIAIIDYGMGNLRSVQKAFEFIGEEAIITTDIAKIEDASNIVLPGVGAFQQAIQSIEILKLNETIFKQLRKGKPFLGICLGMQMLFEKSYEDGEHKGMGILKGNIKKFEGNYKIPHIGWNNLEIKKNTLFKNIENPMVYFVHSYYAPIIEDTSSICNYGGMDFTASIENDNIFATQFHPEKSGNIGLQILRNFVKVK